MITLSLFGVVTVLLLSICASVPNTTYSIPTLKKIDPPIILDKSGIPMVDYGNVDGIQIGMQRNPLTISTTAIEHYSIYKKNGNETAKEIFLNNAKWLVDNAVSHGSYSTLDYKFPFPQYDLQPPWRSAMAQGLALNALIYAHRVTGDQKYLDTAKKLLNSFFVEVKDRGVTYKTAKDGWWYEEFAGIGGKEPRVLNGMMYALLGIHDYYKYTNNTDAKYLFDQGVLALKRNLPRYDNSRYFYSYYDSLRTTNPIFFHSVSVKLLARLYDITNDTTFKAYHDRWENFKIPDLIDRAPPIALDRSGIPIVDYKNVSGIQIGMQRNPVTITHIALDYYSNYVINGNETAKEIFLNNAKWLVDNAVSHGSYSTLDYKFPFPQYDLQPPWRSAMAQGRGLQVLIRAHEVTGDQKYLDTAKKLLNSFFVEVKDRGVTYKTAKDGWWYELFAGIGGKEPRVLNGMMYALLGIHDYYKYTNNTDAKYLFDQGVLALKRNLPRYEYKGNYSNYDILKTTNPLGYHKLHIELLARLYDITNDTTFKAYHDRWENFTPPQFLQRQ